MTPVLELVEIHKRYGESLALDGATFRLQPGSAHALLGENGAGKTTLMRIAYGLVQSDRGDIRVQGRNVVMRSPRDAVRSGIGMVHQHFTLVPALSVGENVALGMPGPYVQRRVNARVSELSRSLGLTVDPAAPVRELSVAMQQRVEILKALARDARLLILDEPTAVLAPSEADDLLTWLRTFVQAGGSVVLITHKLREARAVADTFTVLRQGRSIVAGDASALDDRALVQAMVGDIVDRVRPTTTASPIDARTRPPVFHLSNVSLARRGRLMLSGISLDVRGGELLGVAGVEGAGQRELLRLLAGRFVASSGVVEIPSNVAFVPEDRHAEAVVLDMSIQENVALRGLGGRRGLMTWGKIAHHTESLLGAFDVRGGGSAHARVGSLSGGNQQKLVIARELSPPPGAVVAENPTRGLDHRASADVHHYLRQARETGLAVVMYSADLDELLSLCDRVIAMYSGKAREVPLDRVAIGRAMLGLAS